MVVVCGGGFKYACEQPWDSWNSTHVSFNWEPWEIDINQTSHGLTGCKLTVSLQHVPCVQKELHLKNINWNSEKTSKWSYPTWPPETSQKSHPQNGFRKFLFFRISESICNTVLSAPKIKQRPHFQMFIGFQNNTSNRCFFLETIKAHDGSWDKKRYIYLHWSH